MLDWWRHCVADQVHVHETCYRRSYLGGLVHRARLQTLLRMLAKHAADSAMTWADFGCSNGFIIEQVLRQGDLDLERIVGYDHSVELLALARAKKLPHARFVELSLNEVMPPKEQFRLVTCFETLEHVADVRCALRILYNHLLPNGVLVLSVPNETGWAGLVKLAGRRLAGRKVDLAFLSRLGLSTYLRALLLNRDIDGFREKSTKGYNSHLGFDYRQLFAFIESFYVQTKQLGLLESNTRPWGLNAIWVFKKMG